MPEVDPSWRVLVTGGSGFIGSAVVRYLIEQGHSVLNLDALTYAGHPENVAVVAEHPQYQFVHGNICDRALLDRLFADFEPNCVMHLAAESHVDRSIAGPAEFLQTNILGTFAMLEAARQYWERQGRQGLRFHHISTDEVYGTLGQEGLFHETTAYAPNSPYSASKASSDHLVRAWRETYGLPTVITNCSNNYGPYQFPEKLIPVAIHKALARDPIPVYGTGQNIRDWLHVEDHARALWLVASQGRIGEVYNVGGDAERSNIDVVQSVCALLDQLRPSKVGPYSDCIAFVEDRAGHDFRYAIDCEKIKTELGWSQTFSFEDGLRQTVQWYLDHQDWVSAVLGKN